MRFVSPRSGPSPKLRVGLVVLSLLVTGLTARAGNLFVRFADFGGTSPDHSHPGWIEVQSFGSTISKPRSVPAVPGDFTFSKTLDATSPLLSHASATGHPFAEVQIDLMTRSPAGAQVSGYRARLEHVLITSVRLAVTSSNQLERVTLSYAKITWSTPVFTAAGALKDRQELIWDFTTGTGSQGIVPDATLRVTGVQTQGGAITLRWPALPGEAFRIYSSATVDGTYAVLQDATADATGEIILELSSAEPAKFFQVVRLQ